MTEQSLHNLFEKARNERPETTISEVQKWIGFTGVIALFVAFGMKYKAVFTTKIIIMTSSIIVASSLALGAYFFFSTPDKVVPCKQTAQLIQQDLQREVTLLPVPVKLSDGEQKEKELSKELTPSRNEDLLWENIFQLKQLAPLNRGLDTTKVILPIIKADEYGSFDVLKVSGAADIVLIQGTTSEVRIEGDEAGKRVVRIINEKGTLKISTVTDGKKDRNFKLKVYVTFNELKEIHCSGASEIKSQSELKLENLLLDISGASDIELLLNVHQLKVKSSGASNIELNGKANSVDLSLSGATEFDADELEAKEIELNCSGATNAGIFATEKLKIMVSGASDVKYKGNPSIEKHITGASSIKHL